MTNDVDPLELDRELRRTAARWHRWARSLRRGDGLEHDPFASTRVAGLTAFQAVGELDASDPLRQPLRRWIYRLAEQRINRVALVAVAYERRVATHSITKPEDIRATVGELVVRALSDASRRDAWLVAAGAACTALSTRAAHLWGRRQELARRMGLDSPDSIELPEPEVTALAERWLDESSDAAAAELSLELPDWIDVALGRGAEEGWPARITLRALAGMLDETDLLRSVDLDVGPLPATIAPASFLRGLARLGAAWVDATAPGDQPFVIAHDPYGLRRRTMGALLAGLPMNPQFARRRLDVPNARLNDFRRSMARTLLAATRLAALRVVLRPAALAGETAFRRAFEEHTGRVFGQPLSPTSAGSLVRLEVDDAQRFVGVALATQRSRELTEEHDDDWFRNPRAADELRADAARSPVASSDAATVDAGLGALMRHLTETLG